VGVAIARDATDRLAMLVCRVLVHSRSLGRRDAALGAIARLAAVHRACSGGRDPGPAAGNRTVLRLKATLNYDTEGVRKQGVLYRLGFGHKAPDMVVWSPTGDCRVVRHEGSEVIEGRAWVCQRWLSSSVVVIGVALDVGGRRHAWGSGLA